ncbi:hypothetical protein [Amycolatopsis thermoflava]|uniref:hypothetical protein n=1 Tax=Amycolatopsis thermoflava TaxID=84480 RepID=UPI003D732BBB
MMARKPTRRGIRRRATRHRSGGTVYQTDTVLDRIAGDVLDDVPTPRESVPSQPDAPEDAVQMSKTPKTDAAKVKFEQAADDFKRHGGTDLFNKAFEASRELARAQHAEGTTPTFRRPPSWP